MAGADTDFVLFSRPVSSRREPGPSPATTTEAFLPDSEVPEGGYGWIVVVSCSIISFFAIGTSYSWGIIQSHLVKDGLGSPSTLAFVGSTTAACIAVLAIVNAKLVRVLGARYLGLVGAMLLGAGGILSSWSTQNVGGLFVTTGIIMGVGLTLYFMTFSILPAQYFTKRRGLANGLVYAGGGLGGAIISFSLDALLQSVGIRWTFRIIGIVTLVFACPAALLIKERPVTRSNVFVDWRLFTDFRFVSLFVAGAIGTFPLFVPPFFLPLYSNSLHLSPSTGAGLVASFNFSSAVGRLAFGQMGDIMGPVNALLLSLLMSAISMLAIWPQSESLAPLMVFVIINGAANGGFFATMPTVVGSVFGSAKVAVAMGMIVTGWGGGYLMGAPIAGYMLSAYGGETSSLNAYKPAIYYAGSMTLASAGFVAALRLKITTKVLSRV